MPLFQSSLIPCCGYNHGVQETEGTLSDKVVNGDDVVGLTRGFLYAGSSNIVASLWKVDDLATSDLMQGFYKNMKTMPKRVALQNAQQLVKNKYQHPFYWAAFELTGNGL